MVGILDMLSKPLLKGTRYVTVGTLLAIIILSFSFDIAQGNSIDVVGRTITSVFSTYAVAYLEKFFLKKKS